MARDGLRNDRVLTLEPPGELRDILDEAVEPFVEPRLHLRFVASVHRHRERGCSLVRLACDKPLEPRGEALVRNPRHLCIGVT